MTDDDLARMRKSIANAQDAQAAVDELLKPLSNPAQGEIALAVSIQNNKLRIDFGTSVEWIALDKAHLDIFFALLVEMRKRLP